ncbi:MAG TPA: type II secretion system F family protein [Dehalococcoidia bacterium]
MLALIAAVCVFTAVASLIVWSVGAMRNPVEARLSRLSPVAAGRPMEAPFADRVVVPVLDGIVRAFVQILPHRFVDRTSRQLLSAGSPISVQAFFTVVLLCSVFFPGAAIFLIARSAESLSLVLLVAIGWIAAAGLALPFVWLRRRSRDRSTAIWRSLPDAFDLVTVCVEAGLGLDAALRQVSAKLKGPLSDEISLVLREVGMGRPRREALEDLAYRVDIAEVTTFVHAIVQAEQLGTSLGRVLRAQGVSLRIQRRQRAEEVARRAPVKMVFPLVLFIMPTFFIVTIGPVAVHFLEYVGG